VNCNPCGAQTHVSWHAGDASGVELKQAEPAATRIPEPLPPADFQFPVVGIGASAEGLSALETFFQAMPPRPGMAFVVIMHAPVSDNDALPRLLASASGMAVVTVEAAVRIEKDHVYFTTWANQLLMADGFLRLAEAQHDALAHHPVDRFLRSLAEERLQRMAGVVLSGGGIDGALGLARIKEWGGFTFAQAPSDAENDGMPCSAIANGAADIVLPAAEIPQRLVDLWRKEGSRDAADDDDRSPDASEQALREILTVLRSRTGHDFRHYKRATVLRRIERRLQINALPGLPAYRNFLHTHVEETAALLCDMLISVTNFFRDAEAFTALEHEAIPLIMRNRSATEPVRVWCAGCATGEEAYSVAMLLREAAAPAGMVPFNIFATDIDEHAISVARSGLYPNAIDVDVSPKRFSQFFTKESRGYRIRKEVRERMLFALHNVLSDTPFSRLDLVVCRNVLIYLDRDAQLQVLKMLHFALRPGGILFLGNTESSDVAGQLFTTINKKYRIYRANGAVRAELPRPVATDVPQTYPAASSASRPVTRRVPFAELHQRLLEQYAPPSVLVDRESEIVYLSNQAGTFLRYAAGEPSHNLIAAVRPELRLELRLAVYQALQSNLSVEAQRVRIVGEGRASYVKMTVRPVHDLESAADFLLVLFDEVEDLVSPAATANSGLAHDPIIAQLEHELHQTKKQLQATIEQYETSNEELKASNEELQAINEEMRSATEELETSKEELQSINEEMNTINAELRTKVNETDRINDDLRNLVAASDIATIFIDSDMRIKRYTPRVVDVFNIVPSDMGRSLFDINHRLEYKGMADDVTTAFNSLRLIEREVRSTGGQWYIARFLPYRTTGDRIDGAVLTFIDVTARRLAEERLRNGERRMRLTAETMRDYAIVTMNDAGQVTSWNAGAARLFGYDEAQMLGQPIDRLFLPEERNSGVPHREMTAALENGRIREWRWHLRADGRCIFCDGVLIRLRDDDESLNGFAMIAREIDAPVSIHGAVLGSGANDGARNTSSPLLFMTAVVTELKYPLNLIQANADLLARAPEMRGNLVVARAADMIRHAVLAESQAIDNLLDLARLGTSAIEPGRTPVDWRSIVSRMCDLLEPQAMAGGVALRRRLGDAPLLVEGDAARLEQAVWNLLGNALRVSPKGGGVDVALEVREQQIVLIVRDQGPGIAAEQLPGLFDVPVHARDAASRATSVGVGLALTARIVALHGGRIEAQSEGPGLGACISAALPLLYGKLPGGAPGDAVRGRRILLVERDRATADTFQLLFESEGAHVSTAPDAMSALGGAHAPELVVLDVDGLASGPDTFLALLHKSIGLPASRVIGLSAQAFAREQALRAGFGGLVAKPVVFEDLLAIAKEVLSR
jgi:two-component system CheB/CheR fusion protein